MRTVIQKVASASVSVDGQTISAIKAGLCVLVGISTDDEQADIDYIQKKLLSLRLFQDEVGTPWKCSVKDAALQILCVSQFTLFANVNKGSKPDFHASMPADDARRLYSTFLDQLRRNYEPAAIFEGQFQQKMQVCIVNDGPTTILLDSKLKKN